MRKILIYVLVAVSVAANAQALRFRRIQNTTAQDAAEAESTSGVRTLKTIGSTATAPLPCMGSPRVPVILVQFQNKKFSVADTDEGVLRSYDQFFNGDEEVRPGTTGSESACSVREYYHQQSGGQFTPEFSIIGPVTLSNDYEYYGKNNSGAGSDMNINAFYSEACRLAVENFSVDWSVFDNKNNGKVGFVFFIYAGEGENNTWDAEKSNYDPNNIWPKEGSSSKTVSYEGKSVTFGAYGCTSELYLDTQDGIGVTVHELGHGLGLPDMYDVYYSSYNLFGMDIWDVMDSGCYTMLGRWPCNMTAYERDFMGWYPLETLDPDQAYTLELKSLSDHGKCYKLPNKENANEYLILENRQNKGLDTYMGYADAGYYNANGANHGLMVTHVDYNSGSWTGNTVNTSRNHQRMTIVPADGELISNIAEGFTPEHAKSIHGDLYPGEKNVTELTSYAAFTGEKFSFTVDNIRETADGTILVDINGGDPSVGIRLTADSPVLSEVVEVYSPSGLLLSSPQKGLNIVRTADGKVQKVYVR